MSSKYIVRQPIKNPAGEIIGYEILYHGENHAFSNEDTKAADEAAAANTIYNFLVQSTPKVLKGSVNYMTFTTTLLMKKVPRLFDCSELVIQIDDSVIIHPLSMHFVQRYAKEGYKIAVNEFQFAPRYLALIDSIHYIKINAKATPEASMRNTIEIAHSMNKECIVNHIDSEELYRLAVALGADALEGPFVAERMRMKAHNSSYLQSNFFRLMVAVTRDEPDVVEIENLISADANLTYELLKLANSAYFALRRRATSIHQAIMTLGLGELKNWIYLLGTGDSELDSASEEFLKRSFMRANFCNELMDHIQVAMPISKPEAYLMGTFSTLSYMIEAPLEDILEEIPIVDEIKEALLHKTGLCGTLYQLVLSYETADWAQITALAEELKIPNHLLTHIYFNCMERVNSLWAQLTSSSILAEAANKEDEAAQPAAEMRDNEV